MSCNKWVGFVVRSTSKQTQRAMFIWWALWEFGSHSNSLSREYNVERTSYVLPVMSHRKPPLLYSHYWLSWQEVILSHGCDHKGANILGWTLFVYIWRSEGFTAADTDSFSVVLALDPDSAIVIHFEDFIRPFHWAVDFSGSVIAVGE